VWWLSSTVPGWRPEASPGDNPPPSASVWWCPVFGRVARGGLATTVLVGALSFGMVGQAQAVAPVLPIAVAGAPVAAEAGVAAGAACAATLPVCIGGIAITAAAIGLFATQNTWIPIVKDWFGQDETSITPGEVGAGISILPGLTVEFGTLVNNQTLQARVTDVTAYSNRSFAFQVEYMCVSPLGSYSWGVTTHTKNTISPYTELRTVATCVSPSVVAGARSYNYAGSGKYSPISHFMWGSLSAPSEELSTYRSTVECVKADGSTETYVTEYAGQAGYVQIPSCSAAGKGTHGKSVDVDVKLPGRTDFRDVWRTTPTADPLYPLCDPALPSSAACTLNVYVDGTICMVGDARCLDWASHATSRLQCMWGTYSVPLARCNMLERSYETTPQRISDATTDGDPLTGTATVTDPDTSFPTAVPIPTPGPSGIPVPIPDDPTLGDAGCWPSGSAAWNPLEWVLRPVQCALVWAFVPPEGMGTRMAEFDTAWDGSAAGTWVSTITDPVGDVAAAWSSGGAGCGGPEWTLSMSAFGGGSYPFRPFDSCREPLASVAPVVKGVGVALVFVIGFRAAANPVLGALGLPRIPGRRQLWQHEIHGD
jgi:hypothetical protein